MDLPLHEQLRHDQWRRLIESAGPGDGDNLKRIALEILSYAATCRAYALQQAEAMLKAPASGDTGAGL